MASILEVSPGGRRFFNVFDAAPENEVCMSQGSNGCTTDIISVTAQHSSKIKQR